MTDAEYERLMRFVSEGEGEPRAGCLRALVVQLSAAESREKALAKRTAQVLDAFERRRMGFPLGYEEEIVIIEAARAALAAGEETPWAGDALNSGGTARNQIRPMKL